MTATQTPQASENGASTAEANTRAAAIEAEATLATEAAEIRGEATGLTRELFLKLLPLLRRPIPGGFIKSVGAVKGKPYDSTGITSVQVQIDRMDNILTPLGWRYSTDYDEGGKVAHVTVQVLDANGEVLFERDSAGGVNQASTVGNLYKGSFTNAAKLAFARVGPGHEVYVGVTDLDPDVHEGAAHAQATEERGAATSREEPLLGAEAQEKIVTAFRDAGITDDFPLYLKAVGIDTIEQITASRAYKLRELLDSYTAKQTA